ncbi:MULTISPECIES: sodium:solute symporter family transporter [Proteiniphilum]|uniref:sodium:solute symporter family transporter n=1 Tax=Proteiniphilum TaxID=294702 RepID=UPI003899B589|nr:hypothetical protein KDN43_16240 [Proteiniphilum propionicum]
MIYSTSGGMEAVVWGDVIQGFILVFGALAAFVLMVMGIDGGLREFWHTAIEFRRVFSSDYWDWEWHWCWAHGILLRCGTSSTLSSVCLPVD